MTPQPIGTELRVCEDIAKRQQLGIEKYGVAVADNPLQLRQWLQHAYEECLDQAVYLKRAMEEMDVKRLEPKQLDMPLPKPEQGNTVHDYSTDEAAQSQRFSDVTFGVFVGLCVGLVLLAIAVALNK